MLNKQCVNGFFFRNVKYKSIHCTFKTLSCIYFIFLNYKNMIFVFDFCNVVN